MEPLKKVLDHEEMRKIFSNLEVLETLHAELLRDLKKRWEETLTIGDSLTRIIPFMKLYIDYINNYEDSTKTIEALLSKSKSFWSAVQKLGTEQWPGEQGLNSLRVTPIQRIPRYVLLLKDLRENTSPDHVDYKKIDEAFESVAKMANYINERKRQDYNLKRIAEVAAKLKGNLNQGLNFASDGSKSYSHHFKKKTIVKGTTCDQCKKLMVGLGEKVYICKSCNYTAHGKCKDKVPASCTKPYEQALLIKPTRHIVREGRAKHKKFLVQTGNRHVGSNIKTKDCIYFIFNDALLIVYPYEDSTGEEVYEFDSLIKWRARGTGRYIEMREASDPKSLSVMSPRDLATHFLDVDTPEERASIIADLKSAVQGWKEAKKLDVTDGDPQKGTAPPDGLRLGTDDVVMLLKLWRTASFQISNTVPVRSQTEKEFTAYVIEIKFPSGSVSILKRYSQIHSLDKQLHKHFSAKVMPKMPEKKFFGNTSTNFVQKRCAKLQTYFNDCTKLDKIFELPEMLEFLTTSLAEKDNKGDESDDEASDEESGPISPRAPSVRQSSRPDISPASPQQPGAPLPEPRRSQRPLGELPAPPRGPLPPKPNMQAKPLPTPPGGLQRQTSSNAVSSPPSSPTSSTQLEAPLPTPPITSDSAQPSENPMVTEWLQAGNMVLVAIDNFVPEAETELAFQEGDRILLMFQNHPDWWYGQTIDGRGGYFPRSFTRTL